MKDELLDERKRAEDILLGALGFGEDARILEIQRTEQGYMGKGVWSDGDEFTFVSEEALSELEEWALHLLLPLLHRRIGS